MKELCVSNESSEFLNIRNINSSFAIQQWLLPLLLCLVWLFFVDFGVALRHPEKLMMRSNDGVAQCNSFAVDCPMEFVGWPSIAFLWSSSLLMVMASTMMMVVVWMQPSPWIVLVYANFILEFIGIFP
jgi:hypothetical protein